jgi:hypothetical protein
MCTIENRAKHTQRDYDAAHLYKILHKYDVLLLDIFAQQEVPMKKEIKKAEQMMTTLIDFFVEKMGPEALDGFSEYWLNKANENKWYE